MEDLYTFGKTKYVPADPIEHSVSRFVKNVLLVLYTTAKCTFLGILVIVKSLVFLIIPRSEKDIQFQVALV